jgi:membrane fusion protein, multidrug efflux system
MKSEVATGRLIKGRVATVPAEVTQHGLNGTFAYVVKADQSVEQRPIKIGQLGT